MYQGFQPTGAAPGGQVMLEVTILIIALVLPLLAVLPLMVDLVFRQYNLIVYVLMQPGP